MNIARKPVKDGKHRRQKQNSVFSEKQARVELAREGQVHVVNGVDMKWVEKAFLARGLKNLKFLSSPTDNCLQASLQPRGTRLCDVEMEVWRV